MKRIFRFVGDEEMATRCGVSIYLVFHHLVPLCIHAHEAGDLEALRAIYDFAEWCIERDVEGEADLGNAAGVSFYENIIESPVVVEQLPHWLKPNVYESVRGLFETFLQPKDWKRLKARCANLEKA